MNLVLPLLLITTAISWAQDVTVPTPRGNILVKVNQFRLDPMLNKFSVQGTITNTTDTILTRVTLKVAFYDTKGKEVTALCPSGDVDKCSLVCRSASVGGFLAHQTTALEPRTSAIFVKSSPKTPKIGSLSFSLSEVSVGVSYQIVLVKPVPSDDLSFDDSMLAIKFHIEPKEGIGFDITNKTDSAASINWNSASYVDSAGQANKVVHAGAKFSDKNVPQVPTTIPPAARITDSVFPVDRLYTIP